MTLIKNSLVSFVAASPGQPGYPGRPARPAYTSIETHCTGPSNFWVPVYSGRVPGVGHVGSGSGVLIGYVIRTFPGGCLDVTVYHPAQPALPPIPAVPATLGAVLIDNQIGWNAGAYSIDALDGDVLTTFRIAACPGGIFIGFANSPTGIAYQTIDYAFYFRRPIVDIWERGAWKWGVTNFTVADDFALVRIRGTVLYAKNGALLYTSETPSVGPVQVDCSMYVGGDTVN